MKTSQSGEEEVVVVVVVVVVVLLLLLLSEIDEIQFKKLKRFKMF